MNLFEVQLNQSLREFTMALIPTDEYIEVVTRSSEKVLRALKSRSKASIDRVVYAGSLGKSTEIITSDVDLVVILNGVDPPFDAVLSDWEYIFLMDDSLKVDETSIKNTKTSLQFEFLENGIAVDLLPGTNFVRGQKPCGNDLAQAQRQAAMMNINSRNFQEYSSSLAESQIGFMKQQTEFAHQVVRLGKFWYKTLYLGPRSIYGAKSMLELIAVAAAIREEDRDEKSLLRAFAKFLDDVSKITDLGLAFETNGTGKWKLVNGIRGPKIVEPSNEFNNLADNFKNRDKETENLMNFAKITRDRIRQAMDMKQVGTDSIFNLFRPQPTALFRNMYPRLALPDVISDIDPSFKRYHPDMTIHKKGLLKQPGMAEVIKSIQVFLSTATNTAAAALPANNQPVTLREVKKFVEKMISEDIRSQTYSEWNAGVTNDTHEDYDVTFTVPLSTKIDLGGLKTSFRFK